MRVGSEQEQFSTLIERHAGIVRKVATTYCRNAEDRADLAQEIVAQLWTAYPRYDPSRPFTTWMYRVALNVAISHVRSVYRDAAHFVPLGEEHEALAGHSADHEAQDDMAAIERVIGALDPLNRALLLLYLDDRSHREIADILGLSESNVGTRIGRLKQHFRKQFSEER
jgi:RNA polymerase sigma-70 factor (ECF subfamily)